MQGGSDRANVERGPVWLDRVTAPDLMLIWPEEQGWAQYIGALVTLEWRISDRARARGHQPKAAPGPTLSSGPVLAQNGAGVAGVGECPIVRHHRARPRAPSAAAGRRATTPPGLRDTPPPPVAPGPAVVGDVVPDRPSGPACGVLHEDAPRHRRRRRRCGHARRVRRSPPRPAGDERASVVAVPAAVDARTVLGQPAPATPGARPCALSPCRAHRHGSAAPALMAGGARALRGGTGSADQRQPQNRIGPPARDHPRLSRCGEEHRPRSRRHGERRPDDGGRRRLRRPVPKPRRAHRGCRPPRLRPGLAPPRTAGRGAGQHRRRDAGAASDRGTRRHPTAREDCRRDGGTEEEDPAPSRQHVPDRAPAACLPAAHAPSAVHERIRGQRARPPDPAVPRRRSASRDLSDRAPHREPLHRRRRALLRETVQPRGRRRP